MMLKDRSTPSVAAHGACRTSAPAVAKPGRKKRNLVGDAKRTAKEFAEAAQDDKTYFGVGSRTMVQWLTRLSKDFTERLPDAATEEEFEEHALYQKVIGIITRIVKGSRLHNMESPEFMALIEDVTQFMRMAPVVSIPLLPDFLKSLQLKQRLCDAPADETFWQLLASEKVDCLGMRAQDLREFLGDAIADKVAKLQEDLGWSSAIQKQARRREYRKWLVFARVGVGGLSSEDVLGLEAPASGDLTGRSHVSNHNLGRALVYSKWPLPHVGPEELLQAVGARY